MRHITRRVARSSLVAICCSLAACSSANGDGTASSEAALTSSTASGPYAVNVETDVHYGPLAEEVLDICSPVGVTGEVPAFVVIHGGGWYKGGREGTLTVRVCREMASLGYVAFDIDYRLVKNDATTFPNPSADNTFPTPLVDAQLAVRWVRHHAADYGVDAGHICSWGDSAGGHLAVFLGVLGTIYPGDKAGLFPRESPAVNCVIDNSGPVDFRLAVDGPPNDDGYVPMEQLVNSTRLSDLEAASPLLAVSSRSAPMIVTQGTADEKVLPVNATELTSALAANGVPSESIPYYGGHVFAGIPKLQEHNIIVRTIEWTKTHYRRCLDP